jgi:hypothetical protein
VFEVAAVAAAGTGYENVSLGLFGSTGTWVDLRTGFSTVTGEGLNAESTIELFRGDL